MQKCFFLKGRKKLSFIKVNATLNKGLNNRFALKILKLLEIILKDEANDEPFLVPSLYVVRLILKVPKTSQKVRCMPDLCLCFLCLALSHGEYSYLDFLHFVSLHSFSLIVPFSDKVQELYRLDYKKFR